MIAKTDYAKILELAAAEGIRLRRDALLATLLQVVNETVNGKKPLTPDDSVFTGDAELNLARVSFPEWIDALMPTRQERREGAQSRDLMTRARPRHAEREDGDAHLWALRQRDRPARTARSSSCAS